MTRSEKLAYLWAERLRLTAQGRVLRGEFKAVRNGPFSGQSLVALHQKMREHWNLEANYRIALEWTLYPPCGRISVRRFLLETRLSVASSKSAAIV